MTATAISLNVATFRSLFPPFANAQNYNNDQINAQLMLATVYINDTNGGCGAILGMTLAQQTQALYLMAAHLLAIMGLIATGQTPGLVQGASVDKISVTLTPPPLPNQWQFWLGTTPYGQQLLALLQVASAGGFYFGGRPEVSGFRTPRRF